MSTENLLEIFFKWLAKRCVDKVTNVILFALYLGLWLGILMRWRKGVGLSCCVIGDNPLTNGSSTSSLDLTLGGGLVVLVAAIITSSSSKRLKRLIMGSGGRGLHGSSPSRSRNSSSPPKPFG